MLAHRKGGAIAGIHGETLQRLRYPRESLAKTLWVRRDSGRLESFKAWRCRYNDHRGPTKGGIRFHEDVNLVGMMQLAFLMGIKTALMDLPFGGAKGGVAVSVEELSAREIERISREYVRAFSDTIGPDVDVPAPDINTNGLPIAWMADEYNELSNREAPAAFTGKPVAIGGSAGRTEATGQGACIVLDALSDRLGLKPKDSTVAIQGFGNAGYHCAKFLADSGYRIVAVSTRHGGIHDGKGLDPKTVRDHLQDGGKLADAPGNGTPRSISNAELLVMKCDILVPAATENQITMDNADAVSASVVLEVANGPTTPDADDRLREAGIEIVPDVLANAGGVVVSHLEWVQNRTGDYLSAQEVDRRLRDRMNEQTRNVCEIADGYRTSLRMAGHIQALQRLEAAMIAHGTEAQYLRAPADG